MCQRKKYQNQNNYYRSIYTGMTRDVEAPVFESLPLLDDPIFAQKFFAKNIFLDMSKLNGLSYHYLENKL